MTAPTGLPAAVIGTDVGPLRVYPYGLEWNGNAVTLDRQEAELLATTVAPALELVDPDEKTADDVRSEVQTVASSMRSDIRAATDELAGSIDWTAEDLPRIAEAAENLLEAMRSVMYDLESIGDGS